MKKKELVHLIDKNLEEEKVNLLDVNIETKNVKIRGVLKKESTGFFLETKDKKVSISILDNDILLKLFRFITKEKKK